MNYKKTFVNSYVRITIHTNSRPVYELVERYLDFDSASHADPAVKVDFYFKKMASRNFRTDEDFIYEKWFNKDVLAERLATVTTHPKKNLVRVAIADFHESHKERLLDFIFIKPLTLILERYELFFVHGSLVSNDQKQIFISGPKQSGKSTLAFCLAQDGFTIMADDTCLAKSVGGRMHLFPFRTKMGLSDALLKKYPRLKRHTMHNFLYGGKRRIPLEVISKAGSAGSSACTTILFPKYKRNGGIHMRRLSKKQGFNKLSSGSFTEKKVHQKLFTKTGFFWALYGLVENANLFELTYDDTKLDRIPDIIKANV